MALRRAAFVALLFASVSAAAADFAESADACFAQAKLQPRTAFDVVVSAYPTVFERRMNIKEINRVRPVRLPPQAIAHGLSLAAFGLRSKTKSEAIGWGTDGRVCAWIGRVTVNLTPESVRIYIPREYRPGSCEANQLALHELEHEELYRRAVLKAADKLRFVLAHARDLPGPLSPIDAANPQEAYERLKKTVDDLVRPVYGDLIKTSRMEQDALDTAETYRRLGDSCSGWKRT